MKVLPHAQVPQIRFQNENKLNWPRSVTYMRNLFLVRFGGYIMRQGKYAL